ncbi:hypothetical protein L1987_31415 [Smallanthus sonchifolius]|uniref:Uncharacterized protein n=1 Tax=Smallanthus sonchifolius TaxID=185202 RepID=A0ACB9I5K5_9ASTR|nr:hypothetical protein L1987_31415 [Smallanthus sonchifolius]
MTRTSRGKNTRIVLCGKQAVIRSNDDEHMGLATWAQDSIKEGRLKQIVDSNLSGRISRKCLKEFALLADRCLHSRPKQRPTMAEVVVGLESILALQERTDSQLLSRDNRFFGRRVPAFLFPSNRENSVEGTSLKSLDAYLYTVVGENQILHRFDFTTIVYATENFSGANRLSFARYGFVYKGKLQNGQHITITQYFEKWVYKECMNEASVLVKFEHDENMIQLFGYCIEGTKVYLLYDFASNSTLKDLILGNFFPFEIMYSSLLRRSMLSTKADVYSFGVLVLKTVTGQRVIDHTRAFAGHNEDQWLTSYAKRNWLEGTLSDIIDPRIDVDSILVTKFVEIGLLCVQEDASVRPKMEEVVDMLLGTSSLTLPVLEMRSRMNEESLPLHYNVDRSYSDSELAIYSDTGEVEEFISELGSR